MHPSHFKKTTQKVFSVFLMISLLNGCNQPSLAPEILLQKSIQAHGGMDLLNQIESIQYNKSIKLYTASGTLERQLNQKILHRWEPFLTSMEWTTTEGSFFAQKDSEKVRLTLNGELQKDSLLLSEINSNLDAALYVFWQPFKLTEPAAKKTYLGPQKLLDSIEVLALQVSYSDAPNADLWHYYFTPENYKLRAVQVDHNNRTSLILNELYETQTGLSLNKKRMSYFLDSLGQVTYLRAAYEYEITALDFYKK